MSIFDENGMLILRQQFEPVKRKTAPHPRKAVEKPKPMPKPQGRTGPQFLKVMQCISEYSVGDRISVSHIRKKTGVTSPAYALGLLKMDGIIDLELPGKGNKACVTILRKI